MALLALQGAGNTPTTGEHKEAVRDAWLSIIKTQTDAGNFAPASDEHTSSAGRMYGHGQITIALCEAYGLTGDAKLEQAAQAAIRYALAAQLPDGGWRYHLPDKDENGALGKLEKSWRSVDDRLVSTGTKTAEMAGLESPAIEESFERLTASWTNCRLYPSSQMRLIRGMTTNSIHLIQSKNFSQPFLLKQFLGGCFLEPRQIIRMSVLSWRDCSMSRGLLFPNH